jgi:hypothetical protein
VGEYSGIVVARMTDEERERRTTLRARRTAEAAEADDRRVEERRLQRQREACTGPGLRSRLESRAAGAGSHYSTVSATRAR